jgi:hypothetical protein
MAGRFRIINFTRLMQKTMVKLLKNPAKLLFISIILLVLAAGFTAAAFLYPEQYGFMLSAVVSLLLAITAFTCAFLRQ